MSFTEPTLNQPEPTLRRLDPGPLPKIGWPVVYYPRPGDGMARRNRFPALVLQVDESTGQCGLLIFRAADDLIEKEYVPQRSEQNLEGWEFPAGFELIASGEHSLKAADLASAQEAFDALKFNPQGPVTPRAAVNPVEPVQPSGDLAELKKQVDEICTQLWGKDEPALDEPIVKVIIGLHQRISVLEQKGKKSK